MPRRGTPAALRGDEARRRIAVEAARLISESGLRDYRQAKLKAAARLGLDAQASLPDNRAIEDALREHQRLFGGTERLLLLRARRETALEAMRWLADFNPRLVGPVLEGTADDHSAVCLHLHADRPEAVLERLLEHGIRCSEEERRLRLDRQRSASFPVLRFRAGGAPIDLTLLPEALLRQAPLDRITERPMRRADATAVQRLLADEVAQAAQASIP